MIRITLRQMQYFEALAQTLHFGRAAELIGISQPALSAQIAEMERNLGFKLFERGRGVIHLSEGAFAFRERIERILGDVRELELAAMTERKALEGRFRLGIIPTVAPYLLPPFLEQIGREFPGLRIEIREAITAAILEDTRSGKLDAVIAAGPLDTPAFASTALFEDRFLLAVPAADRTKLQIPVRPESLIFERLMLLEEGHCMREDALAVCGSVKPVSMSSFGATSLTTLLHMVGHGLGVTLIPEIAASATAVPPDVAIIPFRDPVPSRTISLAWRRSSDRGRDHLVLADAIRRAHASMLADARPRRGRSKPAA